MKRFQGVVAIAFALGVLAALGFLGHASAINIYSGQRSGNGHNGVTFLVTHTLEMDASVSNWGPNGLGYAYMKVTNGGSANCNRHRLFHNNWTQVSNLNWAGSPHPFGNDGNWHFDSYSYGGGSLQWGARTWWQVDDAFSGGTCNYGGGAGVYKASNAAGYVGETVPSP